MTDDVMKHPLATCPGACCWNAGPPCPSQLPVSIMPQPLVACRNTKQPLLEPEIVLQACCCTAALLAHRIRPLMPASPAARHCPDGQVATSSPV